MTHLTQMTQTGGNTISPVLKARKWCITLNNYTTLEYDTMTQLFINKSWKYIIGKEIGEVKNTPHLQCYIEHTNAIRFDLLKKHFPRAHLEIAKGSTEQNFNYCCKEDKEAITNIIIKEKLIDIYFKFEMKNYQNIQWKNWQNTCLEITKTVPDRRKINWFYEEKGNCGKTFLSRYLDLTNKCIIVNGKQSDVFNGIKSFMEIEKIFPEIIIIDIPRTNKDYVCYGTMEKIKDGLMFSGKYEGGIIRLLPVHIIVFANFHPNKSKLSEDRWNIIKIEE